jgi:hypothetical protein
LRAIPPEQQRTQAGEAGQDLRAKRLLAWSLGIEFICHCTAEEFPNEDSQQGFPIHPLARSTIPYGRSGFSLMVRRLRTGVDRPHGHFRFGFNKRLNLWVSWNPFGVH